MESVNGIVGVGPKGETTLTIICVFALIYVLTVMIPTLMHMIAVSVLRVGEKILPVATFTVGFLYFNECPVQPFIPIYLVVSGAIKTLLAVILYIYEIDLMKCCCNSPWGIIGLVWVIAGTCCVYRASSRRSLNRATPNYCNPTLYSFAFWHIVYTWTLTVIFGGFPPLFYLVLPHRDDLPKTPSKPPHPVTLY